MSTRELARPGYRLIFRAFITLKNGKRLYAHQFGRVAWAFYVPI